MKKLNNSPKVAILFLCSILIISLIIPLYPSKAALGQNIKLVRQFKYQGKVEIPLYNPNEIILDNIISFNQYPKYPTGCESAALYILLKYYDINVTIGQIVEKLPRGPKPYSKNGIMYGANPEKEFVGNPRDKNSYGCFNEPIANTANVFKEGAISTKGTSLEEIKAIIRTKNPVIAWVNIDLNFKEIRISKIWNDYETGEEIKWKKGEHAVVVYGYDENNIYISNPYNGEKASISQEIFEYNYNSFDQRIVYYT